MYNRSVYTYEASDQRMDFALNIIDVTNPFGWLVGYTQSINDLCLNIERTEVKPENLSTHERYEIEFALEDNHLLFWVDKTTVLKMAIVGEMMMKDLIDSNVITIGYEYLKPAKVIINNQVACDVFKNTMLAIKFNEPVPNTIATQTTTYTPPSFVAPPIDDTTTEDSK